MNTEIFRFELGDFSCSVVSDGTLTYAPPSFPPPADFLSVNAPKEKRARLLGEFGIEEQNWKEWISSYNCLYIETPQHRVLVDTGAGSLGPDTGKLLPNLGKAGVSPEDVDLVILTHGHPDHLGGNTDSEGHLVFPKARWFVSKEEWEFWTSILAESHLDEHSRDLLIGIARKNLLPLEKKLELIDKETEIVPGIRAIAAPGHTPGQMVLRISSQGKDLMYVSDLILHPVHLAEPEWYAAVDVDPEGLLVTRRKILAKLADDKILVMAFHFPFPGLGYIVPRGRTWGWQPLPIEAS